MAVFSVIATSNPEKVQAAITARYGANHFAFSPTAWFVSDSGTSKDVADRIGLTSGGIEATGVVLSFTGYSGWAKGDAWAWLQQFPEARSNG